MGDWSTTAELKLKASAQARQAGGRLPYAKEVLEIITTNGGPLFTELPGDQWVPVLDAEKEFVQVAYSPGILREDTCHSMLNTSGLGYTFSTCSEPFGHKISRSSVEWILVIRSPIEKGDPIKSCSNYYSSYTSMFSSFETCPTGLSCVGSVCINKSSINAQIIKNGFGPPNNVYFAFSLWDDQCRPVALPFETLESKLQVYQRIPGKVDSKFVRQSVKESWNGVLPQPIKSTSKIVLLCDNSGSLRIEWPTIRSSIVSFVQTLLSDPNAVNAPPVSFISKDVPLIGPGVTVPKSIYVSAKVFDGREDLLPVSSSFDGFTEITTPGFVEALERANVTDSGYDPSTNLNGAIVKGLAMLKESRAEEDEDGIFHHYLVVFTDGTDQANRVQDKEVLAAVTEAQQYTSIYGVLLDGEMVGGVAGSNAAHMKTFCPAGVYTISKLGEMKQKFAEISGLLNAFINNKGVFLYCASIRSGTADVQLRVEGSTDQESKEAFRIDAAKFDTDDKICTRTDAMNIKVPNPSFSLETSDLLSGYCESMRSASAGWWEKSTHCIDDAPKQAKRVADEEAWRQRTELRAQEQRRRQAEEWAQQRQVAELEKRKRDETATTDLVVFLVLLCCILCGICSWASPSSSNGSVVDAKKPSNPSSQGAAVKTRKTKAG